MLNESASGIFNFMTFSCKNYINRNMDIIESEDSSSKIYIGIILAKYISNVQSKVSSINCAAARHII